MRHQTLHIEEQATRWVAHVVVRGRRTEWQGSKIRNSQKSDLRRRKGELLQEKHKKKQIVAIRGLLRKSEKLTELVLNNE